MAGAAELFTRDDRDERRNAGVPTSVGESDEGKRQRIERQTAVIIAFDMAQCLQRFLEGRLVSCCFLAACLSLSVVAQNQDKDKDKAPEKAEVISIGGEPVVTLQ